MDIRDTLRMMDRILTESINEDRRDSIEYTEVGADRVIASLKGHDSAVYTKLAQKMARLAQLEKEVTELKAEVKSSTKADIAGLFDATDAVRTRVVETLQFVFTLSKDPAPTSTIRYKEVLDALTEHLTPELINVLEGLKETYKSAPRASSPSLTMKTVGDVKVPLAENEDADIAAKANKLAAAVDAWGERYDRKLDQLKAMV